MANFCPNCGSAVNQTDTFCPTCGSAIVGSTSGLPAGVPINTPPPTRQYYQSVPPVQSTASNILGTLVAVNLINGLTRQLYYYGGRYYLDPYCRNPFLQMGMIVGRHRRIYRRHPIMPPPPHPLHRPHRPAPPPPPPISRAFNRRPGPRPGGPMGGPRPGGPGGPRPRGPRPGGPRGGHR